MPIIQADPIVPLSGTWTHQAIVNEVRVLTSELDNERIQNVSLRHHTNQAISYLTDLLNTAQKPDYGIAWLSTLESTTHASGLNWINLSTPVAVVPANNWERSFMQHNFLANSTQMIPSNYLWGINNLTAKPATSGQNNPANVWKGNCQLLSISEIATLNTFYNDQYRQSICYRRHGRDIVLHIGSQITTGATVPDFTYTYYERPLNFVIWGYRHALLDNCLPETATNSSWTQYVDVPDKHVRLLILLVQKMALESVKKGVDSGTEQIIANMISQIQQGTVAEIQNDVAERTKQKQGFSTR